MSELIAPGADLIELAQTVLLRDPITAVGTVVLRRDEDVRAHALAVAAGKGAVHGVVGVGGEALAGAELGDGDADAGFGLVAFGLAFLFVGQGGSSAEGEGEEVEELHGGAGGLVGNALGDLWRRGSLVERKVPRHLGIKVAGLEAAEVV